MAGAQDEIKKHFEGMYRAGQKPWTWHEPERLLKSFFEILRQVRPAAKVLDLGCGDGWISILAAKENFSVWGIDSSPTAIEEAENNARTQSLENKTQFRVGDALDLPYENRLFDSLIDRGLLHHILSENRRAYMKNILRVLSLSSLMYLSVFSERNPEGIGQLFTRELVEELFGKDFEIIAYKEDPYPTDAPAHLLHFILRRK